MVTVRGIKKSLFYSAFVLTTYLALTPVVHSIATTFQDKVNHLLAFAGLMLLLEQAYPKHPTHFTKILLLTFYGLMIEGLQAFIPGRFSSAADILANTCGLALYCLLAKTTHYFRQNLTKKEL